MLVILKELVGLCGHSQRGSLGVLLWGRAKGAAKASCGEAVVQNGVSGESVSSLPP